MFTLATACENEKPAMGDYRLITINGSVENPREGNIILYKLGGLRPQPVDTADLQAQNTFSLEVPVKNPEIYILNIYGVHVVPLVLERSDLTVKADGADRAKLVEVSGSEDMEMLTSFNRQVREYRVKEFEIRQKYADATVAGDSLLAKKYVDESFKLIDEKQEMIRSGIEEMGVSLATLPAIELLEKDRYFEFLYDLSNDLLKEYPNNEEVQSLANMMKEMEAVALGRKAPEIELPDPEGNMVSTESFRGKYLLIDFWAAWCKPCRRENPNIVEAYRKYNESGFEVLGVSLDRTKEQWVKAIEEDGLPWTHVSDLQYFNSEAAAKYNINAIPFSVLLDREGVIIAKNLRGAKLDQKLSEIFGDS